MLPRLHWHIGFKCRGDTGGDTSLQVRTFDLSSAYRQVGLSEQGRRYAYIRVYNPDTETWAYFQALVLLFGAVKSVRPFLRLARSIWWLGAVACLLMWTSFYDDYTVFSAPGLVRSSELTAAALLNCLDGTLRKREENVYLLGFLARHWELFST